MILRLSLSFIRACFGVVSWGEGFRHLWGVGLSYFLTSMLYRQKRWKPWPSSSILPARNNSAEGTYTCNKSSGRWTVQRDRLFCFSRSWVLRKGMGRGWPLSGLVSRASGLRLAAGSLKHLYVKISPGYVDQLLSWGQLSNWVLNNLAMNTATIISFYHLFLARKYQSIRTLPYCSHGWRHVACLNPHTS